MAKKKRERRERRDSNKRIRKKVSLLDQEGVEWVDYKDVELLKRFMSDRAKIRARRVTGNDTQQQKAVARAIKLARELALLPYTQRVATSARGKRRRRDEDDDRDEREERSERRDRRDRDEPFVQYETGGSDADHGPNGDEADEADVDDTEHIGAAADVDAGTADGDAAADGDGDGGEEE